VAGDVRCTACSSEAVIDQPYRGRHACAPHFVASVEERFRREMHRQMPRFAGGTVAVALSGGKDSAVTTALAHRYFAGGAPTKLVAITVDEGIEGYRPPTVRAAAELTGRLGIEHRVVRAAAALGTTTDKAAEEIPGLPPCSYCGVWRRRLLNDAARELDAQALVVGFNLDDLAQTVLMNLVRGAQVPEREVYLYARLTGLPFDHGECPYAGRAQRNRFREIVWQLEEDQPGTRQALLRTQRELADLLDRPLSAPTRCRECGAPAATDLCRACELLRLAETPSEAM